MYLIRNALFTTLGTTYPSPHLELLALCGAPSGDPVLILSFYAFWGAVYRVSLADSKSGVQGPSSSNLKQGRIRQTLVEIQLGQGVVEGLVCECTDAFCHF